MIRLWARSMPGAAIVASIGSAFGLGTLLILLGASLFVLPGIWVMVKIAFAEYLLVLRGLTPLAALKQSFQLTRGHFLLVLGCVMTVLLPVWMLEVWIAAQLFADETRRYCRRCCWMAWSACCNCCRPSCCSAASCSAANRRQGSRSPAETPFDWTRGQPSTAC